jgi:ammonium transporter, Amt family
MDAANLVILAINTIAIVLLLLGLSCYQAGSVRAKNALTIFLKNFTALAIGSSVFLMIGSSFLPALNAKGLTFLPHLPGLSFHHRLLASKVQILQWALWQSIGLSIVIGATAERLKYWGLVLFSVLWAAFIYPLFIYWRLRHGLFQQWGYYDLGGAAFFWMSALAALIASVFLGMRREKQPPWPGYYPLRGHQLPLTAIGGFFIYLGWVLYFTFSASFNGSSITPLIINGLINAHLAACAGFFVTLMISRILWGYSDATFAVNGMIAGLVMISVAPALLSWHMVLVSSVIASVLFLISHFLLEKAKIDDPSGMIASCLLPAVASGLLLAFWQTYASAHQLGVQLMVFLEVAILIGISSSLLWLFINYTIGLRIDENEERRGLDSLDLGVMSYPEFQ